MKKIFVFFPFLVFSILVVQFFFRLDQDPSYIPSVHLDQEVPAFTLTPVHPDFPLLKQEDLKGQIQAVNFFSSWCLPCKAEHPVLSLLSEKIPIQGINYKDQEKDVMSYLREGGNPYQKIGADPDGMVGIEWGVYGLPETFIIDATGHIRYRHVGPLTAEDLDQKIFPLLQALES